MGDTTGDSGTDRARTLPLLDPEAARAAARDAGMPEVFANVNLFRTTLHHPPIARIAGDVVDALVLHSVLDARLRELAILRTGWRLGSVYEWSNHVVVARRAGVPDADIVAVREGPTSAALDEVASVVLQVVDEALDHVRVAPDTLARARELLGDDRALLELVAIPGAYRTIASVLLTFDVPLEDHVEPWAPDGRAPTA